MDTIEKCRFLQKVHFFGANFGYTKTNTGCPAKGSLCRRIIGSIAYSALPSEPSTLMILCL